MNGLAWGLTQRKRRERARAKSVKQRESLGEEDDTPQWKKVRCYYDDYEDYDCLDPIPDSIYIPYTSPCTLPSCYRTVRRLSHSVCGYLSYLLHTYTPLRGVCSFLCIYILTFPLTTDHILLTPSTQQQHHAGAIHLCRRSKNTRLQKTAIRSAETHVLRCGSHEIRRTAVLALISGRCLFCAV